MKKLLTILIVALYASVHQSCSDADDEPIVYLSLDSYSSLASESGAEYLAIVGDTQTMVYEPKNQKYFIHTANWLSEMNSFTGGRLKAVLQTGDLTEKNSKWEWTFIKHVLSKLADSIPLIYSTGNHDYDWDFGHSVKIYSRNSTRINSFPIQTPAQKALIERFESDRLENALYRIYIKDVEYYILALEFAPRTEVFAWAENLIKNNPDKAIIILNHEFLTDYGNHVQTKYSFAKIHIADENFVAPQIIWERLIYPYDNVRMVVCGHNTGFTWRTDPNINGREVPQIMFNLQTYPHGGNGLMMLLKTLDGHKFNSTILSTISGDTLPESCINFVL